MPAGIAQVAATPNQVSAKAVDSAIPMLEVLVLAGANQAQWQATFQAIIPIEKSAVAHSKSDARAAVAAVAAGLGNRILSAMAVGETSNSGHVYGHLHGHVFIDARLNMYVATIQAVWP